MKEIFIENSSRKQRTLKKPEIFSGIGIHTGEQVVMRFCPASVETGIVFRRMDLPGNPDIPASAEYVVETSRSTTIGIGDVKINTVEHVLAALKAYQIDNLIIELSNIEPPIGHGSSDVFVDMIEAAGIEEQDADLPILSLKEPIYWTDGTIHIVAVPHPNYKVSYTLDYPGLEVLSAQYHSLEITAETFKREIAPCRTFSLYEEVAYLMDKGLIRGGSLDNAVVIKGKAVISKNGLFFRNEMARHKILDIIGDLSLIGFDLNMHIIAIRSGHAANVSFAKKILNAVNCGEMT